MHFFHFPFQPFCDDNRPDAELDNTRLFLTVAEELEHQETRRRELTGDKQQPEKPERKPAD